MLLRACRVAAPGVRCAQLGARSLVVTTLARSRDHAFVNQPGWDFVVVDECLAVQNDAALQTAEAWRQVAAARAGCLLLSATFFRSRFSKLFYMVRMLRSPLPRTEPFLLALLREQVCEPSFHLAQLGLIARDGLLLLLQLCSGFINPLF